MNRNTTERRKRWFFSRSLYRAYLEWLETRTRKQSIAVKRPLFAEALEPRVLFSGAPMPAEVEEQAPAEEAPVAQVAEMMETAAESDGGAAPVAQESPMLEEEEEDIDASVGVDNLTGHLLITDGNSGVSGLSLKLDGGNFLVTDSGGSQRIDIDDVTGDIIIDGGDGDDTFTIDLSGGAIGRNIVYHGGAGGFDTLVVTGGTFGKVTYDATKAYDGVLDFGDFTVTFTGLEPLDLTGSTITDLVINVDPLNAVAGTVTTTISQDAGADTLVSFSHGLESVLFRGLTGTLTINGDDVDSDTIVVEGLGTEFAGNLEILTGEGRADSVSVNGTLDLAERDVLIQTRSLNFGAAGQLIAATATFQPQAASTVRIGSTGAANMVLDQAAFDKLIITESLTIGHAAATGAVTISVLDTSAQPYDLEVVTSGQVTQSGDLITAGDITINANVLGGDAQDFEMKSGSSIDTTGSVLISVGTTAGTSAMTLQGIRADRGVTVTSAGTSSITLNGAIDAGSTVAITSGRAITTTATTGTITAESDISIKAGTSFTGNAAIFSNDGAVDIGAATFITTAADGIINAGTTAALTAETLVTLAGDIFAVDGVTVAATTTTTINAGVRVTDLAAIINITGRGALALGDSASLVAAGGAINLTAGTGVGTTADATIRGSFATSGGTVTVTSDDNLTFNGLGTTIETGLGSFIASAKDTITISSAVEVDSAGTLKFNANTDPAGGTANAIFAMSAGGAITRGTTGATRIEITIGETGGTSTFRDISTAADGTILIDGDGVGILNVFAGGTLFAEGTGTISIDAEGTVDIDGTIDGGYGTVSIVANSDGVDTQGLTGNSNGTVTTRNATASAIVIDVNSGGGTGNAALVNLSVGAGGGISVTNHNSTISTIGNTTIDAIDGTILLKGTNLAVSGTSTLDVGEGSILLQRSTAGDMGINSGGTTVYRVDQAEIAKMTAGTLVFGDGNALTNLATAITVAGKVDTTDRISGAVVLNTPGNVSFATGSVSVFNELTVNADQKENGTGIFKTVGTASISTATADGAITITASDVVISTTSNLNAGGGVVSLLPSGTDRTIDLGAAGTSDFTLSDAELDRITTTSHIAVGNASSGNATFTAGISLANADALLVTTAGTVNDATNATDFEGTAVTLSGNISPGESPGIFVVTGNFVFPDNATFTVEIDGATIHDQISATGSAVIGSNVALSLKVDSAYVSSPPTLGTKIVIVERTGGTGTFDGIAEGHRFIALFGSGLDGRLTYFGGDGDDIVIEIVEAATTTISLDGRGNLVINDVAGVSDNLILKVDGTDFRITDSGNGVDETVAIASVTGDIIINGGDGDDTLTLDLRGGGITRNIVFHGGGQATAAGDKLVVTGGTFGTVTYDATDATDGVLDFGDFTVTFTGLEPLDYTGSTITDLVINVDTLNAVAGTVTTTISQDAGTDTLVSFSHGLESVLIRGLTGTLTITGDNVDGDTIVFNGLGTSFAGNLVIGGSGGADSITVNGAINLPGKSVALNAETVNLNADIAVTSLMGNATIVNVASTASIQDGISVAATGGTVNVAAGTYAENLILSKQLTLKGAQNGTDARGRVVGAPNPAVETVVSPASGIGLDLQTGSNASVIDGFAFVGNLSGATGVVGNSSGTNDNLILRNNHISVATGFTASALFLNRPAIDATIHQNEFVAAAVSTQAVFFDGADAFHGLQFTNNNVLRSGAVGGTGLFVDGSRNIGTSASLQTPLIQGNLFQGHGLGFNAGRLAFDDANIVENIFNGNTGGFAGGPKDSLIARNTFTNNTLYGLRLTSFGNTVDPLRGAQNTTVSHNVFSNNGTTVDLVNGYGDIRIDDQFNGTQSTNTITQNSLGSSIGVFVRETNPETFNLSGNWWGTASATAIQAKILGLGAANVDFTSFLNSGTDANVAVGFQGDFSDLTVTGLGAQTGATARINEGAAAITAGGTLRLNGGPLSATDAATGTVSVPNLNFGADSSYRVDITDTGAGNFDRLNVTGTVTIGSNVSLSTAGVVPTINDNDVFLVIANDGTDAVTGTFAGLPEGTILSTDFLGSGKTAWITYEGGDGNDVAIHINGPVTVTGTAGIDDILVRRNAPDGDYVEFVVNGNVVDTRPVSGLGLITIDGTDGDDTLVLDYTNGNPIPANITYNGGAGSDRLVLKLAGRDMVSTAVNATDGSILVEGKTITYTGLEPIDVSGGGTVTLVTSSVADNITISDGFDDSTGLVPAIVVSGGYFESHHFFNNTTVVINTVTTGGDGNDTITISGANGVASSNANFQIVTGNTGTDAVTISGPVNFAGNVDIQTRALNLNGLVTAANVAFRPQLTSTVRIGASGAADMVITDTQLTTNLAVSNKLTIGRADGTGTVTIAALNTVGEGYDLEVISGGQISQTGNLSTDGTIAIRANQDGIDAQDFDMSAGVTLSTTDTTLNAVSIEVGATSAGTSTSDIRNITVGSGGRISITTLGTGTALQLVSGSLLSAPGTGSVVINTASSFIAVGDITAQTVNVTAGTTLQTNVGSDITASGVATLHSATGTTLNGALIGHGGVVGTSNANVTVAGSVSGGTGGTIALTANADGGNQNDQLSILTTASLTTNNQAITLRSGLGTMGSVSSDAVIRGTITTGGGTVTVTADDDITLTSIVGDVLTLNLGTGTFRATAQDQVLIFRLVDVISAAELELNSTANSVAMDTTAKIQGSVSLIDINIASSLAVNPATIGEIEAAGATLTVDAAGTGTISFRDGSTVNVASVSATNTGGGITNFGKIDTTGSTVFDATGAIEVRNTIDADTSVSLTAGGSITSIIAGAVTAGTTVSLDAGTSISSGGPIIATAGSASLVADTSIEVTRPISAGTSVSLNAGTTVQVSNTVTATTFASVIAAQSISTGSLGDIIATTTASLDAGTTITLNRNVTGHQGVTIDADQGITINSTISGGTNGTIAITANANGGDENDQLVLGNGSALTTVNQAITVRSGLGTLGSVSSDAQIRGTITTGGGNVTVTADDNISLTNTGVGGALNLNLGTGTFTATARDTLDIQGNTVNVVSAAQVTLNANQDGADNEVFFMANPGTISGNATTININVGTSGGTSQFYNVAAAAGGTINVNSLSAQNQVVSGASLTATGGAINLALRDLALDGNLSAVGGTATIDRATVGTIGLGGAAGNLALTQVEVARISAATLNIGNPIAANNNVSQISVQGVNTTAGITGITRFGALDAVGSDVQFLNGTNNFNTLEVNANSLINLQAGAIINTLVGGATFTADADDNEAGNFQTGNNARVNTSTPGANITVNAVDVSLSATSALNSGNGNILLRPIRDNATIGLGGGSGTFDLSDAELATLVSNGSVIIGRAGTGTGAVDIDAVDLGAGNYDLAVHGGSISVEGLDLDDKNVSLTANTGSIGDGGATTDITANAVTLSAANGSIGSAGAGAIDLQAVTLSTNTSTGGGSQFVNDVDSVVIASVLVGAGTFEINGGEFDLSSNVVADTTAIIVQSGSTLDVNGATDTVASVTVNSGGTLKGTGTLNAPVVVEIGGNLAPGQSPGVVATGDLTVNGTYTVELDGPDGAGDPNGHDRTNVTGTVTLDSGTAILTPDISDLLVAEATGGTEFLIIDNDGSDAVVGTFNGLAEGATVVSNLLGTDHNLIVSYRGGDGNDVVLRVGTVTTTVSIVGDDLVIEDTDGADTNDRLTLTRSGNNLIITDANGGTLIDAIGGLNNNPGDLTNSLTVDLASFTGNIIVRTFGGDDRLTVDYAGGTLGRTINYEGGNPAVGPGDSLRILGTTTEIATYIPSATTVGSGTLLVDGQIITFTGLEPVEFESLASVTLNFANANEIVNIANGSTLALADALVVSGTSGAVAFETAVLRNVGAIVIDTVTGGTDGNDNITITSANNAHGNGDFTIITGSGTDTVNVNGAVTVSGDITLNTRALRVNAGGHLTSTGDGDIALTGNAPTSGGIIVTSANITTTGVGTITLSGTGGDSNNEHGISITGSAISTGSGNVTVTGQVSTAGGFSGVLFSNVTTTTTGAIAITGTGGDVATSSYGINISGNSDLQAGTGITLSGTSGDAGVRFSVAATLGLYDIETTAGNISITGTRNDGIGTRDLVEIHNARVDTDNGSVSIIGTSTSPIATSQGYGIYVSGTSDIEATTGITLTGNSGGGGGVYFEVSGAGNEITTDTGNIAITGTGGNQFGVRLANSSGLNLSTSGAGTITIAGTGGDSNTEDGVEISNTTIFTGSGNITVTGQVSTVGGYNGVDFSNVTATTTGAISIAGTGGNVTGVSYGINILNNSDLQAGTGITLAGTSGDGGVRFSVPNTAGLYDIETTTGNISITGTRTDGVGSNGVVVIDHARVNTGNGSVSIVGTSTDPIATSLGYAVFISGTSDIEATTGITLTGTNGGGGVYFDISGAGNAITTDTGNIAITGTGIVGYGVRLAHASGMNLSTTGAGTITISGTGGDSNDEDGVEITRTAISTGSGNVIVTGQVAASTGYSGVEYSNVTTTTTGAISITGTGGNIAASSYGINIAGNSDLQAGTGITLAGNSGDGGVRYSVSADAGLYDIETASGNISITGTRTDGIGGNLLAGPHLVEIVNARVDTNSGSVSIIGTSTSPIATSQGYGVTITGTSDIEATTGVTITGNSGGGGGVLFNVSGTDNAITTDSGNIAITGTGILGYGVRLNHNVAMNLSTTGAGTITISGSGGDSNSEEGVEINNTAISTGTGNITVTGQLAASTGYSGVEFSAVTIATGGAISITGTGGNIASSSYGILIAGNSDLQAGTGITLAGTSGDAGVAFIVPNTVGLYDIETTTGNISITGTRNDGIGSLNLVDIVNARIDTGGGSVSIVGTSNDPIATSTGYGVTITGTSDIEATTGITLTGNSGGGGGVEFNVSGAGNAITTDAGDIAITGTGTNLWGVRLTNSAGIALSTTGAGNITISGTGGDSNNEDGVEIVNAAISTGTGNITVTGQIGAAAGFRGIEFSAVTVTTGGAGAIAISGTGGSNASSRGVSLNGLTTLTSANGALSVTGSAAGALVDVEFLGTSTATSTGGAVTITGDEISLTSTAPKVVSALGNNLRVQPLTDAGTIGIGNGATGALLANVAFLDKLAISDAHTLTIGRDTGTGNVDIRPVNRSAEGEDFHFIGGNINVNQLNVGTNNLTLTSNAPGTITDALLTDITAASVTLNGTVTPGAVSGPGILVSSGNTTINNAVVFEVNGNAGAGNVNGHDQIFVDGPGNSSVTLNAATSTIALDLTGLTAGELTAGAEFVLINNDTNSDAVSGTFSNATAARTLMASNVDGGVLDLALTYTGGDGNDVTLQVGNVTTRVFIDGSNNLVIEDINDDTNDQITVQRVGANLVITEANTSVWIDAQGTLNGSPGDLTNSVTIPLASFTGNVILRLGNGNDTIIFNDVDLIGTQGIVVEDGAGTDAVTFQTFSTDLNDGTVTVNAETVTLNAAIATGGSGNVTLNANTNNLTLNASVTTGGAGIIDLDAGGAITQSDGTSVSTGSGAVTLNAAGNITIAAVSTTGNVTAISSAGAILDGGDAATDVTAASFAATGTTGVGAGNALETAVANLEADGGTGGIFVANTGNLTIGGVNGTLSGLDTSNAAINVSATTSLTTTEAIDATGGDVTLIADTVALGVAVASSGGNLVIAPFTATTTIGVGGGAGTLNLDDAELALLTDGFTSITIGDLAAGTGAVDVDSSTFTDNVTIVGGNIAVAELNAGANNATLTARTGAITDGGDVATDVTAANVTLNAGGAIGATGDILSLAATTIATNSTLNGANGNQFLTEADIVTVAGFNAGTGTIEISGGEFDLVTDNVVADATSIVIETGTTLDADATDTFAGVTVRIGGILKGDGNLQTTPVTLEGGGTITPGEGGPGDLGTGDLELDSTAVYFVDIDGTTAGTNYDQLVVTGTVNLNADSGLGSTLTLDVLGFNPTAGQQFVIIDNNGTADAVTGTFNGLLEGTYLSAPTGGGLPDELFQITYLGISGTDNDVVLTATGQTATTNVYIDGLGNLVVEDILVGGSNDNLSITRVGSNFVIEDLSGNVLGTLIVGATQTTLSRIVVPVSLVTGIIVNTLDGTDTITLGALGTFGGQLTVNGGDAFDTINQNGDAVAGGNIGYTAETINFGLDADVSTTAANGTISVNASRNLLMDTGSSLGSVGGSITLAANQAGLGTGQYNGMRLKTVTLTSVSGDITLTGRGGSTSSYNYGVNLETTTATTGGAVTITGTGGGDGTQAAQTGVLINYGSAVTGGSITVTGQGGNANSTGNAGGAFIAYSTLTVTTGNLVVTGTGANNAGTTNNGVAIANSTLTSTAGTNILIEGIANGGFASEGIEISAGLVSTTGLGTVTLRGTGATGASSNVGVLLGAASQITTVNGEIRIEGTSRGTLAGNHGVNITAGTVVSTTGTGNLVVAGTGGIASSSGSGVLLNTSTLQVVNGNLNITGTGRAMNSGRGVETTKGILTSSGTGLIQITGSGAAGATGSNNAGVYIHSTQLNLNDLTGVSTLQITGTGGGGTTLNHGVLLTTSTVLSSLSGDVSIIGQARGTGGIAAGVSIANTTTVSVAGGGDLTVTGTGSATGTVSTTQNRGIQVSLSTLSVANGLLTMTGVGGGAGNGTTNHGIDITGGATTKGVVKATGSGSVVLTGTAGKGGNGINGSYSEITSVSGNINITGHGGTGASNTRGIFLTNSTLESSAGGALTLRGHANASTTGTGNVGVWIISSRIGTSGTFLIEGTGGGGTGTNHGIYMQTITKLGGSITRNGFKGSGATSLDLAGNFV